MSKATLIDFYRDLMISDEALEQYKLNRPNALTRYDLTDAERSSVLNDDFAAIYRGGVPLELLIQANILTGLHPFEYMQKLQSGMNYTGPGMIPAGASASGDHGAWAPSE